VPGISSGHEMKKPLGHPDSRAGMDVHLACPGMSESLVQRLDAFSHGQQLDHFLFVQK
jgi:hypothetical protein